jgi:hypothetical protein
MSATIEIVRFDVPEGRADELVAGHERARLAIDSLSPGWIWSRLARFSEVSWIEIVAWRDRAGFERALELSVNEPAAADWFDLADPGWTIVLGEPVEELGPTPPELGTIELITAGAGEDSALVAAPDAGSHWSLLVDLEGREWAGDSWRPTAPGMLRMTVPAPERESGPPSWTEVATIAHSYDAAGASV